MVGEICLKIEFKNETKMEFKIGPEWGFSSCMKTWRSGLFDFLH